MPQSAAIQEKLRCFESGSQKTGHTITGINRDPQRQAIERLNDLRNSEKESNKLIRSLIEDTKVIYQSNSLVSAIF